MFFVALCAVVGALLARPAAAEGLQALSISPPFMELTTDPGQTATAKIKLTNISNEELLVSVQTNDFEAGDENGVPNIIFDESKSSTFSLRDWVAIPEPFKVKSKETKTVEIPIKVPTSAEPGGHYGTVRFTGTISGAHSGVALNASIGALILLQVSGDIKRDISVVEFFSATQQMATSNFFESAPIAFVTRIKNNGSTHEKPTGTIEVKNIFGATVSTLRVNGDPDDAKNPPKSVLPQSIRRFEQTLNSAWLFGPHTATLKIAYGGQNEVTMATVNFLVIPYKLFIVLAAVGIALFFAVRSGLRRHATKLITGRSFGAREPKKHSNIKWRR